MVGDIAGCHPPSRRYRAEIKAVPAANGIARRIYKPLRNKSLFTIFKLIG
jgi:hypothetical protein